MKYTKEQRDLISSGAKGKVIASMDWEEDQGGYWVINFEDGSELCVRLMSELV